MATANPVKRRTSIFIIVVALFGSLPALAAEAEAVDVILALDNSGSMKTNDPHRLMLPVVSAFADSLAANSRFGLVLFDEGVQLVLPLTLTGTTEFRSQVETALEQLTYKGQRTDIPAGIERAIYALRQDRRDDAQQVVVFITDGIVDTGSELRNLEKARWLQESLAPEARQLGIRVFGVALTEAADFQLIQSVSRVTGGSYYQILQADEISNVFAQVAEHIAEPIDTKPDQASTPPVIVQIPEPRPTTNYLLWGLGLGLPAALALLLGFMLRRRFVTGAVLPRTFLQAVGGQPGEKPFRIRKQVTRVGRESKLNDLVIPEETVSARHAVIEFRDGKFYLRDLQSANGTYLNGKLIGGEEGSGECALNHRDRIRFDAYEFQLFRGDIEEPGATHAAVSSAAGATQLRAAPPAGKAQAQRSAADDRVASPVEEDDGVAATRVKTDVCPNHPSWKAAFLCPQCHVAYCKTCMVEVDGMEICTGCRRRDDKSANSAS